MVNNASSSESTITQFFPWLKLALATDPKFVGKIYIFQIKKTEKKLPE